MKRRHPHGFTIIELVLAIVILSIMAVTGLSLFVNVGSAKIDAAAKKLASDLTYAKQLARNRHAIYGISFDVNANTYTVHSFDPTTSISTTILDPLTQQPMVVDFSTLPGLSGTDIQSANFGGTNAVRFQTSGIPQNLNNVVLAGVGSVILEEGGVNRSVTVQPQTGEAEVQ